MRKRSDFLPGSTLGPTIRPSSPPPVTASSVQSTTSQKPGKKEEFTGSPLDIRLRTENPAQAETRRNDDFARSLAENIRYTQQTGRITPTRRQAQRQQAVEDSVTPAFQDYNSKLLPYSARFGSFTNGGKQVYTGTAGGNSEQDRQIRIMSGVPRPGDLPIINPAWYRNLKTPQGTGGMAGQLNRLLSLDRTPDAPKQSIPMISSYKDWQDAQNAKRLADHRVAMLRDLSNPYTYPKLWSTYGSIPAEYAPVGRDYDMSILKALAEQRGTPYSMLTGMQNPADVANFLYWQERGMDSGAHPDLLPYVYNQRSWNSAVHYNPPDMNVVREDALPWEKALDTGQRAVRLAHSTASIPRGLFSQLPQLGVSTVGSIIQDINSMRGAENKNYAVQQKVDAINNAIDAPWQGLYFPIDYASWKAQQAMQPQFYSQEELNRVVNPETGNIDSIGLSNLLTRAGFTSAELARNLAVFGGVKPNAEATSFMGRYIRPNVVPIMGHVGFLSEVGKPVHDTSMYLHDAFNNWMQQRMNPTPASNQPQERP